MLLALFLACTCSEPASPPAAVPAAGTPLVDAEGFANVAPAEVTEVLQGDGRSYLHIHEADFEFWASVPQLDVAVGDDVRLGTGPLKDSVHSAELSRDFTAITVIELAEKAAPGAAETLLTPPEGGITLADLYARRVDLAGKPVKVRGRVVKANNAIFGKNWYHVRDGTGAEGSNDLAITTQATAKLGDVIVAEARLTIDKDLGFGYFFSAILDDAAVTVEAPGSGLAPDAQPVVPEPAPATPATALSTSRPPPLAPPAPAVPRAPAAPVALVPLVPKPAKPGLPPAPVHEVYGIPIGTLDQASLDAWTSAHHLTCTSTAAMRRATTRTECKQGLAQSVFPERPISGKFTTLLFSRGDTGPVHYVSLAANFSIPAGAGEDFQGRGAALAALLGKPSQERPFDAGALGGKLVRFAETWNFADLDVSLVLFKAAGDATTVTETWAVPGIEAAQGARPGTKGHGEMPSHPAGWNPHVVSQTSPIR